MPRKVKPWPNVIVVLLLAACSSAGPTVTPTIDYNAANMAFLEKYGWVAEMNSVMTLGLEQADSGKVKLGSIIRISVENWSPYSVRFPADWNVELWTYSASSATWQPVSNAFEYHALDDYIELEPTGGLFSYLLFWINPVLPASSQAQVVRAIIVGDLYLGGKPDGSKAAAFIDVVVEP